MKATSSPFLRSRPQRAIALSRIVSCPPGATGPPAPNPVEGASRPERGPQRHLHVLVTLRAHHSMKQLLATQAHAEGPRRRRHASRTSSPHLKSALQLASDKFVAIAWCLLGRSGVNARPAASRVALMGSRYGRDKYRCQPRLAGPAPQVSKSEESATNSNALAQPARTIRTLPACPAASIAGLSSSRQHATSSSSIWHNASISPSPTTSRQRRA
mmetsp:Transcript_3318/g.7538  ORF Transcript_3318/g.7538 Transcript_3318/m.7538 type:complete len:215 (+) Transcript_3318:182-826(+)